MLLHGGQRQGGEELGHRATRSPLPPVQGRRRDLRPRAFAVLKVMTSSNFVACSAWEVARTCPSEDLVDIAARPAARDSRKSGP